MMPRYLRPHPQQGLLFFSQGCRVFLPVTNWPACRSGTGKCGRGSGSLPSTNLSLAVLPILKPASFLSEVYSTSGENPATALIYRPVTQEAANWGDLCMLTYFAGTQTMKRLAT